MADILQLNDESLAKRLRLHTTVFCQCFSPCGKYLAAGTNFGHIAIFSLTSALSPDATEINFKPIVTFKAQNVPVYCMESTERYLVSGGSDEIQAWLWTDIISKNPKLTWAFSIPSTDHFARPETNSLAVSTLEDVQTLYAGCGDNRVHLWDMESGKHLRGFEGHTDYVHSVVVWNNGTECASAAEDGTVRLWDTRTGSDRGIIEPYKHESCVRPSNGKWLSCVAVDKAADWLVCGGGPHMCMWHLRTLNPTSIFSTNKTQNIVRFQDDALISGGSGAFVHHWAVNGDKKSQIPCSPTNVFDIIVNDKAENTKVLSVNGNTNKIDICTNFGYTAFSLSVY